MTFGLEVRDPSGTLLLAITDRITRYYGSATLTLASKASTFVTVPGMTTDGTWICFPMTGELGLNQFSIVISNGGFSAFNPEGYYTQTQEVNIFRY